MKKFVLICFTFLMVLTAAGCTDKPAILFNKQPITKDTVMDYDNFFKAGSKIYYLILIPKPSHSRYAYIQIIKKDNDYETFGYKLFWANTVRLKDEQMYYYDDYIVINQKGAYVMQVYLKDNPQKVYAAGQFFVR